MRLSVILEVTCSTASHGTRVIPSPASRRTIGQSRPRRPLQEGCHFQRLARRALEGDLVANPAESAIAVEDLEVTQLRKNLYRAIRRHFWPPEVRM